MKKKHLDKIKKLVTIWRDENKFKDVAYIMEEAGELAKDILEGDLEHAKSEAVDVVITGLGAFYSLGGVNSEMDKILTKQLRKWEKTKNGDS